MDPLGVSLESLILMDIQGSGTLISITDFVNDRKIAIDSGHS